MIWLDLFISFLIANLLGYGGGPSTIPLIYEEIVIYNPWFTDEEFSSMLALGNTLPGPIATKIGAYAGYYLFGWTGMFIALAATVIPSAAALIILLNLLQRHRKSNIVKGMTLLVQPVIAVMMLILTWHMAQTSIHAISIWQSLGIAAVAFWALNRRKIHPAIVISAAFVYGGIVLS
jgi:chromate transporter